MNVSEMTEYLHYKLYDQLLFISNSDLYAKSKYRSWLLTMVNEWTYFKTANIIKLYDNMIDFTLFKIKKDLCESITSFDMASLKQTKTKRVIRS